MKNKNNCRLVNNEVSIKGVGAVKFAFLDNKQKYFLKDWKNIIVKSARHFKRLNVDINKVMRYEMNITILNYYTKL